MITLFVIVVLVVLISATCSATEASLYAISWTTIEKMRKAGSSAGTLLFSLRSNIDRPITAVLTLNTVANTAGATIAGAVAASVLNESLLPWFAGLLTVLILAFGEILPKTLGVLYAAPIASALARPLTIFIRMICPIIWLCSLLVRLVTPVSRTKPQATEDDIRAVTSLSLQSGRIKAYEETAIRNILALDQKRVHDIMTPRTVVFSLPEDMTVAEAYADPGFGQFSRIPVYGNDNEDIVGIVHRRRIEQCLAEDRKTRLLSEIMQTVRFVPESETVDKLLMGFLEARQHLFVVLDEYGGLAGVVSLEDVIEEMLGQEIIDESDRVADMRELARQSRRALSRKDSSSATRK